MLGMIYLPALQGHSVFSQIIHSSVPKGTVVFLLLACFAIPPSSLPNDKGTVHHQKKGFLKDN